MTLFRIICALFGVVLSLEGCAADKNWNGSYVYSSNPGATVAEQSTSVNYKLSVSAGKCELNIQGFQVAETILCTIEPTADDLNIKFRSYANGNTKNIYDVAVYEVGKPLFQLHNGKVLETTWGTLCPDEKLAKRGTYFIKETQK